MQARREAQARQRAASRREAQARQRAALSQRPPTKKLIGYLIVTHGRLAIELLNAAQMIVGELHHITAVSLRWHDDVDMATTMIEKALERVRGPEGVLI